MKHNSTFTHYRHGEDIVCNHVIGKHIKGDNKFTISGETLKRNYKT